MGSAGTSTMEKSTRNWFQEGGRNSALFRPEYPFALATYLASIAPGRTRALDVGCGTGQTFRVACRDEAGLIGEGVHRRAIIDLDRFTQRMNQKIAAHRAQSLSGISADGTKLT